MNPAIKDKQLELLIALQEIDKEIQKLTHLKENIPREIEQVRLVFEKINNEIAQLEDKIEQAKKEQRSIELETHTVKDLLANTREKLPSVKTNKEYSAILQETENLKNKINSLEENEIALMESIEANEGEHQKKLSEKNREEQKFQEVKKRKEGELEKIEKLLEEENSQRNELVGKIETKWSNHYTKVVKIRKGPAVVTIDKDTCQGCHSRLIPQLSIDVRQNNSVITCTYCSRFLFSETNSRQDKQEA